MRGDGVGNGGDVGRHPSQRFEDGGSLFGGQAGGLGAQGRVLLDGNAVVQHDGRREDTPVPAFHGVDAHGVAEDADQMSDVVGPIVAFRGMRQKRFGKRLVGREGLCERAVHAFVSGAGGGSGGEAGRRARIFW